MNTLEEIKNNAISKKMTSVFKGRHILFLENDMGHYHADGNLEKWLIDNKIRYHSLFDISKLPLEYIKNQIDWAEIICFQTTWTYEISHTIETYLRSLKDKKTIVECYISEPSWWYKPKGVSHDIYVLDSNDSDMDEWNFDKLRLHKPIWERK